MRMVGVLGMLDILALLTTAIKAHVKGRLAALMKPPIALALERTTSHLVFHIADVLGQTMLKTVLDLMNRLVG